jgi:hypothetical protein
MAMLCSAWSTNNHHLLVSDLFFPYHFLKIHKICPSCHKLATGRSTLYRPPCSLLVTKFLKTLYVLGTHTHTLPPRCCAKSGNGKCLTVARWEGATANGCSQHHFQYVETFPFSLQDLVCRDLLRRDAWSWSEYARRCPILHASPQLHRHLG